MGMQEKKETRGESQKNKRNIHTNLSIHHNATENMIHNRSCIA